MASVLRLWAVVLLFASEKPHISDFKPIVVKEDVHGTILNTAGKTFRHLAPR